MSLARWMRSHYKARPVESDLDRRLAEYAVETFEGVRAESLDENDGRWDWECEAALDAVRESVDAYRLTFTPCPACGPRGKEGCHLCGGVGALSTAVLRRRIKEERSEIGSLQFEAGQRMKLVNAWEAALNAGKAALAAPLRKRVDKVKL